MGSSRLQLNHDGSLVVKRIKSLFAILIGFSLLLGCSESTNQLQKGKPTPGFSLQKLEGGEVKLPDELKGKVISVRFWADWCPFCKSEMNAIEPVYKKYNKEGLEILAINVRQDKATAEAFLADMNISYDVLLDQEGEVARNYGVAGLPTTFFLDRSGNLYTRILGESTPEVFESIVKELM